jgi:hypothetical protein
LNSPDEVEVGGSDGEAEAGGEVESLSDVGRAREAASKEVRNSSQFSGAMEDMVDKARVGANERERSESLKKKNKTERME